RERSQQFSRSGCVVLIEQILKIPLANLLILESALERNGQQIHGVVEDQLLLAWRQPRRSADDVNQVRHQLDRRTRSLDSVHQPLIVCVSLERPSQQPR